MCGRACWQSLCKILTKLDNILRKINFLEVSVGCCCGFSFCFDDAQTIFGFPNISYRLQFLILIVW